VNQATTRALPGAARASSGVAAGVTAILAIARNTFREAARNKVLYSLLFFAILLIVSALALGQLSLNEEVRMTRDLGLYGIDIFSVLIAIFVGVNLLYKELDLKTVYTILPKPIARWQFVLGKWLGMLTTLALQIAVMGVVLALVTVAQGAALDTAIAKALWLLLVNVTVVTSVAILFSSFSSPFLSGFFSLGVFLVGRSVPDIRLVAARIGGPVGRAIDLASYVVPNLHLFYPSGAIIGAHQVSIHGRFVGADYLAMVTAYGVGYSLLVLGLAVWIFRRRDFV
jgi:ABC-type transport system involved in multi-copper enzyme maturation permease subunit